MQRYPNPKVVALMHFFYVKTTLKVERKCKNTKHCQYLGNGWKDCKTLKVPSARVEVSW